MAEVRIPTDQIPDDILQRLQAILDCQPLTSPVARASALESICHKSMASSQPTTCWSSGLVSSLNTTVKTSTSSPAQGKKLLLSPTPAALKNCHSNSATAIMTQTTMFDEVDGETNSPKKRKVKDVLDDSGIVRVFPVADDVTNLEFHSSLDQSDSEVIRIFPEMDRVKGLVHEATIVRALTPTALRSSPRSDSTSIFGDNRQSSSSSGKDWNSRASNENSAQSTFVSSNQSSVLQVCDTIPIRPASVSRTLFGSCDMKTDSNNAATLNKGDTNFQAQTSLGTAQVPACDLDMTSLTKHLLTPSFIPTVRRSPGIPTPPQTPDDCDPDVDDDDVFTYNLPENEYFLPKPQPRQACRKGSESNPRRGLDNLRHHSDRSCELRHHKTHQPFTLGLTHNVAEKCVGDRKTRKRLSFDDFMISQSPSPRPHHHSDPSQPSLPTSQRPATSLSSEVASRSCQIGPRQSPIPATHQHSNDSSPTVSFCRGLTNEPSSDGHQTTSIFHHPSTIFHQATPMFHQPTSATSHAQNSPQSPIQDMSTISESVTRCITPCQHRRLRLHSEGDTFSENHNRRVPSPNTDVSPHSYNQVASYGKRRRTGLYDDADQRPEVDPSNQLQMTWSRDQSSLVDADCACSKIAQNFLQLVEGAYRRVGQIGGAHVGFERFRQELALTNDILRESLVIVEKFRAMCRHESVPSSHPQPEMNVHQHNHR